MKGKNKAKNKVIGQKAIHKTIVRIIGVIKRMYEAQEQKTALPYEEFLTKLENTTAEEFYSLPIKEKN